MMSTVDPRKSSEDGSSSGRLLRDIEEISKALFLHKPPPKALTTPSDQHFKSARKVLSSESKSKMVAGDFLHKDKKSSIWNWKPLKALTHIKNHPFDCCFFLHVHAIEGLPSNFNDLSLCVNWKRKDEVLQTRPALVYQGVAEFEETLMHKCTVYGSRNGPHNSAKYDPKIFLLHASVISTPALDIGKQWIDLTRLLPFTLEELEEEKRSSGKWTTSFKLTGKGIGAMLTVSFGFSVVNGKSSMSSKDMNVHGHFQKSVHSKMDHFANLPQDNSNNLLWRLESIPNQASHLPCQSLDMKGCNDIIPNKGSELARSISFLYKKLNEEKLGDSKEFNFFYEHTGTVLEPMPISLHEVIGVDLENGFEFHVVEHGVELPIREQSKSEDATTFESSAIETICCNEIFKHDETTPDKNEHDTMNANDNGKIGGGLDDSRYKNNEPSDKEQDLQEFESILPTILVSGPVLADSSPDISKFSTQEDCINAKLSYKAGKMAKSLNLDDITESVANDFFNLLGIKHSPLELSSNSEPDSPRERLLRQFEKDALTSGNLNLVFDAPGEQMELSGPALIDYYSEDCPNGFDMPLVGQLTKQKDAMISQSLINRRKAKMLESLETEALMRQWGLNEKAFQNSPRINSDGFGSPVYILPPGPPKVPSLGEGLGQIIQTKDGGFLRSMNDSLFRNAKNESNLIMQASGPVVLPAAMGSSIMEILQYWASAGVQKMFMQINDLMPLEDITGKAMQQIAWETTSESEVLGRLLLVNESEDMHSSFDIKKKVEELPSVLSSYNMDSGCLSDEIDRDFISLEDLVPLALGEIEALSVEGLRIQSCMTDEEAPSSIKPQPVGKKIKIDTSLNSKEDAGMQLLNLDKSGFDTYELISLSISLDEWVKLDSGAFNSEVEDNERLRKILEAHQAKFTTISSGRLQKSQLVNPLCISPGLLGNSFTIALKLQLRDPFRDYETVGSSMLALIQVEKIFLSPKQEVGYMVSERSYKDGKDDNFLEQSVEGEIDIKEIEEKTPEKTHVRFKISEVHVAGMKTDPSDNLLFCSRRQQQSGSRWLLSTGMGKTNKNPFVKSSAIIKSSSQVMRKIKHWDTLWSISSHVHGTRSKRKKLATQSMHFRNPDIVFPKETIRSPSCIA